MSEQNYKKNMGETYYTQVNESIKDVFELTTRIDERVQSLTKKQEDLEGKVDLINSVSQRVALVEQRNAEIDKLNNRINDISKNIDNLETKVQTLEGTSNRSGERWKQVASFGIQLLWVVVASYVLWKLHLSPPATP